MTFSMYAKIENNSIIEFINLNNDTYNMWTATNNPKTQVFLKLEEENFPLILENEVAEEFYEIDYQNKKVIKKYNIRQKTPDELRKTWTAYQFLNRFTPEERALFRSTSLTDPLVADFQMLAMAAQEVISDDPMTIMGMNYLVSIGLITELRKNEILS